MPRPRPDFDRWSATIWRAVRPRRGWKRAPERRVDIVIANGFFDYIADPAAVLRHLHSLNRGKLIATFPLYTALRVPFRKLWRMGQRCYVRFYTRRGIIAACEAAGYRVERLERHGPIALLVASATPLSSSAA